MIPRVIENQIRERMFKGKAIIVLGPRQSGKTTLVNHILSSYAENVIKLNADDPTILQLLDRPNTYQLKQIIGKHTIIFIDEAQRVNEIGLTSKLIVDEFPNVQLIMSGSSAFDLSNKTNEPLTGRKWTYHLWPVSWQEWEFHQGFISAEQDVENRLVFGFYPDVLNNPEESHEVLKELMESYLYKDILIVGNLNKPIEIQKLLQALAFQIGNEVSMRELSEIVGIDPKTVDRYIDILEKAFVVFRLNPLSRNLRNEIKTNRKVYFYDNGIRNALIGQLQPFSIRQDKGQLWENFLISERKKMLDYQRKIVSYYFWRTKQQQEVDYVEEVDGNFFGFEFKWSDKKSKDLPKTFSKNYHSQNMTISRQNFREFVGEKGYLGFGL
jgi:uncharacterized protein